jgi:hypothetical protein
MSRWNAVLWLAMLMAATTVTVHAQGHSPEPGYQDDRSTPEAVIGSFYDAINKREYARAYSYWELGAASRELAPFDEFQHGYADTTSVDVTLGDVRTGVGAGQLYFTVPVTLQSTHSDGSMQTFVGCYTLHLGRPQLQAVPPFLPLSIQRASIQEVDPAADTDALMLQSCLPV